MVATNSDSSIGPKRALKKVLKSLGLFRLAVSVYSSANPPLLRTKFSNGWLRLQEALRGRPVPSSDLLFLVAGSASVRWFLSAGAKGFESIQDILTRNGIAFEDLRKILDFGCGCGRVMRHWHRVKNIQLFGTDYNPELIAWCRDNLRFASFNLNEPAPPLKYADNEFDLIYALSIVTHLPEDLQVSWMQELGRIIRPGGYLLVTTHGEYYLDQLTPAEGAAFRDNRLVVRFPESSGTNRCATFHPVQYVREKLAGGFEVVDFIPCGAKGNPMQDAYLLRKK